MNWTNIWAVGKREFRSFFNSPIAYIAITVFLVMIGCIFFFLEGFFEQGQATMRPFFEWVPLLFIFLLPAISMRLISEEKRTGSLELLITLPIRDIEVILGKLLGAFLFLVLTLALTLVYPLVIRMIGPIDPGPVIGGYVGLLLLGLAYLGIGLMTSCWTRNQIVAFILAVLICGFFYFIDTMLGSFWEGTREFLSYLSFKAHFDNAAKGILDTRDLLFYLSVTGLSVIVGAFSLQSRRWT
jgi:ABC-2 type transport system permease protein